MARNKFAVLILAAGSSSRMGQSKQLLRWGDSTLLTHAIRTAAAVEPTAIAVVLGANALAHQQSLQSMPVQIIINDDWALGMGASLKKGLSHFLSQSELPDAIIVMVCDQPFLTPDHLSNLTKEWLKNGSEIVASKYAGSYGVPVLFAKNLYRELIAIPHGTGAKKIIENHLTKASFVFFEGGEVDLDTPDDYAKFVNTKNN